MDLQGHDIRDISDLFEYIFSNKDQFLPKHALLVSFNEQFIDYYVKNGEELYNIVHPPTSNQVEEDVEEDWDFVHPPTHQEMEQFQEEEEEEEENSEAQPNEETFINLSPPEFIENVMRLETISLKEQVSDIMHQSQSDQYASKVLKEHGCLAQSIFFSQQSSEKAFKALWLQQGNACYKINSQSFKSHDLVALAQNVVSIDERNAGTCELVSHARLMEAIGDNEYPHRSLCVRARYASTSMYSTNTQPWFVFNTRDVNIAYQHSEEIYKYCVKKIGFKNLSSYNSCIIQ